MLYADDICILTENEADLQKALNIMYDWCTRWNMTVNTDKTQIVHFRTQSKEQTGFMFIYGEQNINVVSQYKYLGLILNEHLYYAMMTKMVAKSAGRSIGLLIAKSRASGRMPYAPVSLCRIYCRMRMNCPFNMIHVRSGYHSWSFWH